MFDMVPLTQLEVDDIGFIHAHDRTLKWDMREALLSGVDDAILLLLHGVIIHPEHPGVDGVGVVRTFVAGGTDATTTAAGEDVDGLEHAAAGGGADVPIRCLAQIGIHGEP
jgi:hypothetical protein